MIYLFKYINDSRLKFLKFYTEGNSSGQAKQNNAFIDTLYQQK